jgi:hypothetical protein
MALLSILSSDRLGSYWYMVEMVWKSGLEWSRSTTRCLLYVEMCFFMVVYLRCTVLKTVAAASMKSIPFTSF